jgi:hypothetical protein
MNSTQLPETWYLHTKSYVFTSGWDAHDRVPRRTTPHSLSHELAGHTQGSFLHSLLANLLSMFLEVPLSVRVQNMIICFMRLELKLNIATFGISAQNQIT